MLHTHLSNPRQLERLQYAKDPQTFLQQWLRRAPPADEHPLLMRAVHADAGAFCCEEGGALR